MHLHKSLKALAVRQAEVQQHHVKALRRQLLQRLLQLLHMRHGEP